MDLYSTVDTVDFTISSDALMFLIKLACEPSILKVSYHTILHLPNTKVSIIIFLY